MIGDFLTILTPPEWMDQAACRNVPDPDVFFPERGRVKQAVELMCAGCPVRDECLEYSASGTEYVEGFWAGLGEHGRRKLGLRPAKGWQVAA